MGQGDREMERWRNGKIPSFNRMNFAKLHEAEGQYNGNFQRSRGTEGERQRGTETKGSTFETIHSVEVVWCKGPRLNSQNNLLSSFGGILILTVSFI